MSTRTVLAFAWVGALFALPEMVQAQAQAGLADPEAIAGQNLRGFTHMFIAFAIAWVLVLGWVVSISRRLGRVEEELRR